MVFILGEEPPQVKKWHVYILRCRNSSFYTGMTGDLSRRVKEHNAGRGGRYTASFGPVELVWKQACRSRSSAMKKEARIKRLPRKRKECLVEGRARV